MSSPRFMVTSDELKAECLKRRYRELLAKPDVFPSQSNWDYIIDHRMTGVGEGLYRKYLVSWLLPESQRCDYHEMALKEFPRYLKTVPRDYAMDVVYGDVVSSRSAFVSVVEECELFDCGRLFGLAESGDYALVVDLLGAFQPEYDGDDLDAMRSLVGFLEDRNNEGLVVRNRGMFKSEDRYVCPAGHSNPADVVFCGHDGCGLNIQGYTEAQVRAIADFRLRISALQSLLDE